MSLPEKSITDFIRAVEFLFNDPVVVQRFEKIRMVAILEGAPELVFPDADRLISDLLVFGNNINLLEVDQRRSKAIIGKLEFDRDRLENQLRTMRNVLQLYLLADTEEKKRAAISSFLALV